MVFMHFFKALRPILLTTLISISSFWLLDTYFWSYFNWLFKSGCQNLKLAGNTFPPFPSFWSPVCQRPQTILDLWKHTCKRPWTFLNLWKYICKWPWIILDSWKHICKRPWTIQFSLSLHWTAVTLLTVLGCAPNFHPLFNSSHWVNMSLKELRPIEIFHWASWSIFEILQILPFRISII